MTQHAHLLGRGSISFQVILEFKRLESQVILEFRKDTSLPICYTLDAGPNVHLLYPDFCADKVQLFIEDVLKDYCFDNKYIEDKVG